MTVDELRHWLAQHQPDAMTMPEPLQRVAAMAARGDAAGALRLIQDLKTVELVRVEKYDKTHVATPGTDGLRPVEVVEMTFEDGRLVASHIRTTEGGD